MGNRYAKDRADEWSNHARSKLKGGNWESGTACAILAAEARLQQIAEALEEAVVELRLQRTTRK